MAHFIISTNPYRAPGAIGFSTTQKVVSVSKPYASKAAAKSVITRSLSKGGSHVVCEFETADKAKEYAKEVEMLIN